MLQAAETNSCGREVDIDTAEEGPQVPGPRYRCVGEAEECEAEAGTAKSELSRSCWCGKDFLAERPMVKWRGSGGGREGSGGRAQT